MFVIDDKTNNIKIIKKDTASFMFTLDNHVLADGDKVTFTVNKAFEQEPPILQKVITSFENGGARITLTSEDTDIKEGTYFYDVQVNTKDGRVDTVIRPSRFKVMGGITY